VGIDRYASAIRQPDADVVEPPPSDHPALVVDLPG